VQIKANCIHNNRHCDNTRVSPSAMTMGNRPAALNREVTGANRPARKLLLDFVALKWTTKQSKIRDWQCTMFLGWTCSGAAPCLAERSLVWPPLLPSLGTLTIKVGATGFVRNVKKTVHSQGGGGGNRINTPLQTTNSCLRSTWIY